MAKRSLHNIDRNYLDDELAEHPQAVVEAAERYAYAKRKLDRAKSSLKVIRAEMLIQIRSNPNDYDLPNATAKMVESALDLCPEFIEAEAAVDDAQLEVDLAKAVVTALEHRKRSLEGLVKLHGQSYFSTPHIPYDAEAEERSSSNVFRTKGIRRKRRRRKGDAQ